MLPFSRLGSLSGGGSAPGRPLQQLFASKPARLAATAVLAVCFALLWIYSFNTPTWASPPKPDPDTVPARTGNGRLHLLIPATSSNSDLCKLLLSAQILGYPTPVLINYGDHESEDKYVQHLGKVEGILSYLEQLETSEEYTEDLVLIIDGFDIWFQLRPEILIKRFYAVNEAANARAVEMYGADLVDQHDIRQTIVFGPDKICWPVDFSRPACWAVPESPLPPNAFGPQVDYEERDKNDVRWLNSGTVMGAATDLRNVFSATLEAIQTNHTTDSDQFYFANLFGDQEYARASRKPSTLKYLKNKSLIDGEDLFLGPHGRFEPRLGNIKTEYHIGLDYTSAMFQTLAFWKQQLTWTRVVDSWEPAGGSKYPSNPRSIRLPKDIEQSLSPFEPFKYGMDIEAHPGWSEVELAYNVITKEFPVVLHITGNPDEKPYRAWWWSKLWFQAEAEKLRLASQRLDQREISSEFIGGLHWFNAEMGDAEDIVRGGKGGAFTDRRGWLSWNRLCKSSEEDMYRHVGDEWFHPRRPAAS